MCLCVHYTDMIQCLKKGEFDRQGENITDHSKVMIQKCPKTNRRSFFLFSLYGSGYSPLTFCSQDWTLFHSTKGLLKRGKKTLRADNRHFTQYRCISMTSSCLRSLLCNSSSSDRGSWIKLDDDTQLISYDSFFLSRLSSSLVTQMSELNLSVKKFIKFELDAKDLLRWLKWMR